MPQIRTRQIGDGQITAPKIAAGAGIETSKLADGAEFVKRNGSVPFNADADFGNFRVKNIATPTTGTDAANRNYVDNAIAALNSIFDSKPSARARATGNVNIANPGTATFDTIVLANGELLFLTSQSAPAENGLYVFNGSGAALTRHASMDAWVEIPGALIAVEEGAANADELWLCTANQGGTLGVTSITFFEIPLSSSGLTNSNFVDREAPSGAINGVNTAFNLANAPVAGSEHVYLNGVLQEPGGGNDYTIAGQAITMLTAPLTGEKIVVSYRK